MRRSISCCIRSHSANPCGRITIVPRTGPLSASSAFATTSWYQRGKSSERGVSTGALAMAAEATGPGSPAPSGFDRPPGAPMAGALAPAIRSLPQRVTGRSVGSGAHVPLELEVGFLVQVVFVAADAVVVVEARRTGSAACGVLGEGGLAAARVVRQVHADRE